jgi:hypothetical protein
MKLYFGKNKNKYNFGINNGIRTTPMKPISISDINIHKIEYNMNTIKKRVPSLFIDNDNKENKEDDGYYFASTGVTNLRLTTYNEFIHDQAILFFNILSRHHGFEYALFAGNSVGLLRSGNNLPWGDDYDIIILEKHATIFSQVIAPELENFGFKTETIIKNDTSDVICGIKIHGPTIQFNKSSGSVGTNNFQCDVFFSHFDKNKFLKNCGDWGLYHQKNIPYDVVLPFKMQMFHGMFLPFFNNPKKEVEICYTNIDKCSIFSHHLINSETIFYNKWENAYLDFKYIIKNSIENTKKAINANSNFNLSDNISFHKTELNELNELNELVLNANNKNIFLGNGSCILSKLKFFSYLSKHNVGSIVAHADASEFICEHAVDVKYYFPKIKITYIDDGCKPSPVSPIFYIYIDIFIIQSCEK